MRFSKFAYSLISVPFIFCSCVKEYSCEHCTGNEIKGGNVVFFTPGTCINGKLITLIIDDSIYLKVDVFPFKPECSTPGTTAIALSPGIHLWKATCSDRTIAGGMIEVLSGNTCQVEEIK